MQRAALTGVPFSEIYANLESFYEAEFAETVFSAKLTMLSRRSLESMRSLVSSPVGTSSFVIPLNGGSVSTSNALESALQNTFRMEIMKNDGIP